MSGPERMRVLMIAPNCDGTDTGEAWSTHQWCARMSQLHDVTVLTYTKRDRPNAAPQLPSARVIEWNDLPLVGRFERFNSMLKPGYARFAAVARRWIRSQLRRGEHFDLAHQVAPLAPRYASPAAGLGIPLVIGPVGGGVTVPAAFDTELGGQPWFVRLRALDSLRARHDPALRRTYQEARLVLGVAPYVARNLEALIAGGPRFQVEAETGIVDLPPIPAPRERRRGRLRLLFVGRFVPNKGVRLAVRALAQLDDLPEVTLDMLGKGPLLEDCRRLASELGVSDRVRVHGAVPRERVEDFYRDSDLFLFPSLREASGNVVFESLRNSLPVVAVRSGGPGHMVDASCGRLVEPTDPDQLVTDLAAVLGELAEEPGTVARLAVGARERVAGLALWENKAARMSRHYIAVARDGLGVPHGENEIPG